MLLSPNGIEPISSPGSKKSHHVQSIYTYPPLGKLYPSQSPRLTNTVYDDLS